MQCIKTTDHIKKLGTILGIWAHPDDETYTMAGIMAAAVQNGQTVAVITATRGEAGVQDESRWPAARLGEIRIQESEDALRILGVTNHHWLDYPDGECKNINQEEAVERIAEFIREFRPDSVLSFGPDGMTGHDDHKTSSKWAEAAIRRSGTAAKLYYATQTHHQYEAMIEADKQFNIFFNIDRPPVCRARECAIHFDLDEELYLKKLAALKAMPSQTEGMLSIFEDSLRVSLGTEAFVLNT
ncbi:PIG-L family deacetylase [soil metagenome]